MKWYVLFTQYHHQRTMYERMLRNGFQPYLPLAAEWRKSQRGLEQVATPYCRATSSYVAISRCMPHSSSSASQGPSGFRKIAGRFLGVPDEEIPLLRRLGDSDSPLQRTTYRLQGSYMRVVQGLLHGIFGLIRDEARTTLLGPIHSLQASIAVEINGRQVMRRIDMGEERRSKEAKRW
jgi:hypothetical protein